MFYGIRLIAAAVLASSITGFGIFVHSSLAQVWTEPTAAPPGDNANPPIWNIGVSSSAQTPASFHISGNARIDGQIAAGSDPTTGACASFAVCGKETSKNGVGGYSDGSSTGVAGVSVNGFGVVGGSTSSTAIYGSINGGPALPLGIVSGVAGLGTAYGVYGMTGTSGTAAVYGESPNFTGAAVYGLNTSTGTNGIGVYGAATNGYGGWFVGKLNATGNITQNGVLVCLSNGTNCLGGGGGGGGVTSVSGTLPIVVSPTTGAVVVSCPTCLTASGTTNYVAKFTASSTLGNSNIVDTGTNVGVNKASPSYTLDVGGTVHGSTSIGISAILGESSVSTAYGIQGMNSNTGSSTSYGVYGYTASASAPAVMGKNSNTTGPGNGVRGESASTGGFGVYGYNTSTTAHCYMCDNPAGVYGFINNSDGSGVYGVNSSGIGIRGVGSTGVLGQNNSSGVGVKGQSNSGYGVWAASTSGYAIYADGGTYGLYTPDSVYASGNYESGYSTKAYYASGINWSNGVANYMGNWPSSYYWGIGPASTSSDNTLRIGQVDWSGNWLADSSQSLNIKIGGGMGIGQYAHIYGNGDLGVSRADGTGVIYLGSQGSTSCAWGTACPTERYIYYNGSQYVFPGASLWVNGTTYNSDRNLKTDIVPLSDSYGLDVINRLDPVSFFWKDQGGIPGKQYGFIAQDVREVMPDIITDSKTGTLLMNYNGLFAPIVKSIQEQQKEIEDLQNQIKQLKALLNK